MKSLPLSLQLFTQRFLPIVIHKKKNCWVGVCSHSQYNYTAMHLLYGSSHSLCMYMYNTYMGAYNSEINWITYRIAVATSQHMARKVLWALPKWLYTLKHSKHALLLAKHVCIYSWIQLKCQPSSFNRIKKLSFSMDADWSPNFIMDFTFTHFHCYHLHYINGYHLHSTTVRHTHAVGSQQWDITCILYMKHDHDIIIALTNSVMC